MERLWKCVKGWCDEEESVGKVESEGKVEKVERLECLMEGSLVDVASVE